MKFEKISTNNLLFLSGAVGLGFVYFKFRNEISTLANVAKKPFEMTAKIGDSIGKFVVKNFYNADNFIEAQEQLSKILRAYNNKTANNSEIQFVENYIKLSDNGMTDDEFIYLNWGYSRAKFLK